MHKPSRYVDGRWLAMANALASEQDTLAQNLGELSNQYRFQDYQTQQALEEAGLDRSVNAQLADLARNAQSRDSAQARMLQGQIAAAQLYDQGIGRSAALSAAVLFFLVGVLHNWVAWYPVRFFIGLAINPLYILGEVWAMALAPNFRLIAAIVRPSFMPGSREAHGKSAPTGTSSAFA